MRAGEGMLENLLAALFDPAPCSAPCCDSGKRPWIIGSGGPGVRFAWCSFECMDAWKAARAAGNEWFRP